MTTATTPTNAVETVTLIQVNAAGNNNKFYELSRMPDGSTLARWGRIGAGNAQTRTYPGHGSFQVKLNEKLRKGYTVFDGASTRACKPHAANGALRRHVAAGLFPGAVPSTSAELLDQLVRYNRHAIDSATGGRITVSDSGSVTTALGPVSLDQVTAARSALAQLRSGYDRWAVEKYLTLIPQKIANVRETDWVTPAWCRQQDDLLDALESAVVMSAAAADDEAEDVAIPFRHTMTELGTGDEDFARIAAKFDHSRNSMHAANRLKLRRVWTLVDAHSAAWDARKDSLKHTRELWHGTTTGNVLSILRTGLICPPSTAGAYNTTGRMFGDGVYFSDQSTKSLNYAIGSAPGQRGRGGQGNPLMFLADVVMGRECRSTAGAYGSDLVRRSRTGTDDKGRKFDSLYIRGGHCGVLNNEMIVWRTDQIKLTHLCEFQ
ncbi:WGR domain-containing protein [Mycolicibacterium peregrinum]|uniref:WGR domain-containing protein n=1 Tax=Mycolicibacterium peregrinum TaxID=43304 RepID=UPI003AAE3906